MPDTLKYDFLDEKKIYPVIISANLSDHEEKKLLKTLKKHRATIGYTLDDLKGISPTLCQHKIKLEKDAKLVVDHQRRLNPKMKEVVRNEILKLLEAGIVGERSNFKKILRTRKIMVMHSNERGECCLRALVDRSRSVDTT